MASIKTKSEEQDVDEQEEVNAMAFFEDCAKGEGRKAGRRKTGERI